MSHTLNVWSSDAETTHLPSGVSTAALVKPLCPLRARSSAPLCSSHTFSVRSYDDEMADRSTPPCHVYSDAFLKNLTKRPNGKADPVPTSPETQTA